MRKILIGGCIQAFSTALLTRLGLITPDPLQQFLAGFMLLAIATILIAFKEK